MNKLLQAASTLTDRYQTTIPEAVREILHLSKRDKITYTIEENGKVIISRANEEDPVLGEFLNFLANDINKNPTHVQSLSPDLVNRARQLIAGVEVDLDASLDDEQDE